MITQKHKIWIKRPFRRVAIWCSLHLYFLCYQFHHCLEFNWTLLNLVCLHAYRGHAAKPWHIKFTKRSPKLRNLSWQGKSGAYLRSAVTLHLSRWPYVWCEGVKRRLLYQREGQNELTSGWGPGQGQTCDLALRDFHGSRLLQGHTVALLDHVRTDWWRDEQQIDD